MVEPSREYRIDECAREAGTTVRNIRAYQDRGLIPPPRREGRVGIYTQQHLARLRLIGALLDRGYTIDNIRELLQAWESGQELGDVLGLEAAITDPWSDEVPIYLTVDELVGRVSDAVVGELTADEALAVLELGLVEIDNDRVRIPSPRLFNVGLELLALGIPLDQMLATLADLRGHIDSIAGSLVDVIATHLFDTYVDHLPAKAAGRLAVAVQQMRPFARVIVDAELARALDTQVRRRLGEAADRIFENIEQSRAAASRAS